MTLHPFPVQERKDKGHADASLELFWGWMGTCGASDAKPGIVEYSANRFVGERDEHRGSKGQLPHLIPDRGIYATFATFGMDCIPEGAGTRWVPARRLKVEGVPSISKMRLLELDSF